MPRFRDFYDAMYHLERRYPGALAAEAAQYAYEWPEEEPSDASQTFPEPQLIETSNETDNAKKTPRASLSSVKSINFVSRFNAGDPFWCLAEWAIQHGW
ncbi:hypothetical protein HBH70_200600 [Parastagonospora nodorum]|nr:hypothetical protein HBH53_192900 [Parastagonospora nodorum]KAH4043897.1 hypothetical protein HBH49_227680 [Parastagonospora nodorum]KAH4095324.1 hypothetical protein HBH46_171980 [Parastagonospora nodorum]KAH4115506.1 hypothetical protein HBH47_180700 [Parastagonospora nodorum]KAH5129893.1 hypothetical protein HBH70_200600 [Parastagonospora nodorum]